MFLLNSRLGRFSATSFTWHPLFRSYGVNLPSSLTTLLPLALGFSPHLPVSVCGTGTYDIPHLTVSHRPVFLLNSCLSLFSAAHLRGHPFSRSYGVILPSSLTTLLPLVLGFSPHPPVSVYGTGTLPIHTAFLVSVQSPASLLFFAPFRRTQPTVRSGYVPASLCLTVSVATEFQPYVHRLRLSASP